MKKKKKVGGSGSGSKVKGLLQRKTGFRVWVQGLGVGGDGLKMSV